MFKSYSNEEARLAIRKALEGTKVFESSTKASSPSRVAAVIQDTAREDGIDVTLRMAPKGVLISHAERVS